MEILITLPSFNPQKINLKGYKIVIENPVFILTQKLSSLFYLEDEIIKNRFDYIS